MKKIGIIGGIGPESTIEYYRLIIKTYQERLSARHYPELLLHSIDMTDMLNFVFRDQLDELVNFLAKKVEVLKKSNVDYVVLASNTPHLVFDPLSKIVDVKMISIVEETCKAISESGIQRLALFGTQSTMSKGFYQATGKKYGLEIISPSEENQQFIHDKYMGELVFNQIKQETKQRLIHIALELEKELGIQGLILGGTELPLILKQGDFDTLSIFDTTRIHVQAIVDRMLE